MINTAAAGAEAAHIRDYNSNRNLQVDGIV